MTGRRVKPAGTDREIGRLFEAIEASGKSYPLLEKETGIGRGRITSLFRGKNVQFLNLQKLAKAVGGRFVFLPVREEKEEEPK